VNIKIEIINRGTADLETVILDDAVIRAFLEKCIAEEEELMARQRDDLQEAISFLHFMSEFGILDKMTKYRLPEGLHNYFANLSDIIDMKEKEAKTAKPEPEVKPEEPKMEPDWTPEVGMLIKSDPTGIWQIEDVYANKALKVVDLNGEKGIIVSHLISDYCPIAELEGLKVRDAVYAIRNNGNVHKYFIYEHYNKIFWVVSHDVKFPIGIDGVPFYFGSGKQMFWRTKERAERFGK
jgi:hypothetical protein